MTRIMTITSGSSGVGKTHLAVNLSLEMVRRGRQVGLYHVPDCDSPVDCFIDVQHIIERPQQATADHDHQQVISRGYLGVDILSSEKPLADWSTIERETLAQYVNAMDVEDGYDDFFIDTSGMGPRELLACCLASPLVLLVVTPDKQSQAEAFALLRILQMNGFEGGIRLLVNRVPYAVDAQDIQKAFNHEVSRHLGIEAGMPWYIVEDTAVPRSERYRQAFSAVFPDSDAAAAIVVIADDFDSIPEQDGPHVLAGWWERFIERVQSPLRLPGNVLLEMQSLRDSLDTATAPHGVEISKTAGGDSQQAG